MMNTMRSILTLMLVLCANTWMASAQTTPMTTVVTNTTNTTNTTNSTTGLPVNVTPATTGFRPLPFPNDPYIEYLATYATSELLYANATLYGFSQRLAAFRQPWSTHVMRGHVSMSMDQGDTYVLRIRVRSNGRCAGGFVATVLDYLGYMYVTNFGQEIPCGVRFGFFP
jgi:hypothetical protein